MRMISSRLSGLQLVCALIISLFLFGSAQAHVHLNSPNGGEVLNPGTTVTIEWNIIIQHNSLNWDLEYSTTGAAGPWMVIAMDQPIGDPTANSVHTFAWTVPATLTTQGRVRVIQDNSATDYQDISDADFVIGAPNDADGDGVADSEDNCPVTPNQNQMDTDDDGIGDACDECPGFDDALDDDSDGVPNGCDICFGFDDALDWDEDGKPDGCDNCPFTANPGQEDSDSDNIGDACEVSCCTGPTTGNVDCTGIIDIGDVTVMIQNLFITLNNPCCQDEADIDQSGLVDIGDLTVLISSLFITLNPMPDCPSSQAQLQITLSPNKDNTLYEDAGGSLSNGIGSHLFAGKTGQVANSLRRAVVAFDISGAIAPGALIDSVELVLNMSKTPLGAGPQVISLHRLLADWGEGTSDATLQEGKGAPATPGDATWLHNFSPGSLWTTIGGDYDPTSSASQSVDGVGSYMWGSTAQVIADVQSWVDNPQSDFGWILIGNEVTPTTAKRFDSKDHASPSARPALTIYYNVPVPSPSKLITDQGN